MKRQAFPSLLVLAVLLATIACKGDSKNEVTPAPEEETIPSAAAQESPAPAVTGTYATESYARRAEGYDWVGVRVRDTGDGQFWISFRSRPDKKKRACTFGGLAYPGGDTINIIETSLVQEFPIAGGKTRQVSYELENGENSREFRVRNVSEY